MAKINKKGKTVIVFLIVALVVTLVANRKVRDKSPPRTRIRAPNPTQTVQSSRTRHVARQGTMVSDPRRIRVETVAYFRRLCRTAPIAWVDAELAAHMLTPLAGATPAQRRALLESLVAGMPGNQLLPAGFIMTAMVPFGPRGPFQQVLRNLLVVFTALQLAVDVIAIIVMATTGTEKAQIILLTAIGFTLVESVATLVAALWPGFIPFSDRLQRTVLWSTTIAIVAEIIVFVGLWGVLGMNRTEILSVLWPCVLAFTVADIVASVIVITRD